MTADDRTAAVLASLLDGALDDERVKLPPRALVRIRRRMAELAELAGYHVVRQPPDREL